MNKTIKTSSLLSLAIIFIGKYSPIVIARFIASSGLIILNLLVGKYYDASQIGFINVVLSFAVGISVLCKGGFDSLSVRVVGVRKIDGKLRQINSYLWSSVVCIISCFFLLAMGMFLINSLSPSIFISISKVALYSFPLGLVLAIGSQLGAVQRAVGSSAIGQLTEIGTFAQIFNLLILCFNFTSSSLGIHQIYEFSIFAYFLYILIIIFIKSHLPSRLDLVVGMKIIKLERVPLIRLWLVSATGYLSQWAGVLIGSFFLSMNEIALLSVSQRYSMVLFVLLGMIGGIRAPIYAGQYKNREFEKILKDEARLINFLFLLTVPLLIFVIFFSNPLLEIFGLHDNSGSVLVLIFFGQVINVLCGCSLHMLPAFGLEREALYINISGSFFGVIISVLGAFLFGVVGAALGVFFLLVVSPSISFFYVRSILKRQS